MNFGVYIVFGDDEIYLGRAEQVILDKKFPNASALHEVIRGIVGDFVYNTESDYEKFNLIIELR